MTDSLYGTVYDNLLRLLGVGRMEPKDVEKQTSALVSVFQPMFPDEQVNIEALFRDAMSAYNVWVGTSTILEDNRDHVEWLHEKKALNSWSFWKRYEAFLSTAEKMPPAVVLGIDNMSEEILRRLEDPERPGAWDRRGMVVGNVQSGKTSNYIGLICKAVDAGYKIIIVLAGTNNDLRSQTQKRIDKGFLGRDTSKKDNYDQTSSKIGAGELVGYIVPPATGVTSADADGDFKKKVHKSVTITPGGDPIIAVVKKNVTPLRNLLNWFQSVNKSGNIANVPLLLIDDEADNASIDTNAAKRIGGISDEEDERNPTRINGYIRQILNCFSKSAYVGYTATPFANIFIYPESPEEVNPDFGEDLYPRSFIVNLHAPSNYLGPEKVFGLYKDKMAGIEAQEGLPLVKKIIDYTANFPDKHKSTLIVTSLPASLHHALYAFILVCAARSVRGQQKKHNSMLVHVTRYVNVQANLCQLIKAEMRNIVTQLEMRTGPQYETLITQLKEIWEIEFQPITLIVRERIEDPGITDVLWNEIEPMLYKCAAKIETKAINGKAADGGLEYDVYPNGCNVIAIGGDKLSRGLTLEGLSVSYYTRASKMYDTLLQMGRWFGYRPGYVDLCRLYTSPLLANWYQHIAVANEELRNELDFMASMNATPERYGLKVRTHPDGMIITALNKMRNSEEREVTFAARLVQTTRFYKESRANQANYLNTENWLKSLGQATPPSKATRNNYTWTDVPAIKITEFLNGFTVHNTCFNTDPRMISQYILAQISDGELINWTVALISTLTGRKLNYANCLIGMPWRTDQGDIVKNDNTIFLIRNNLITESDQEIDLSEDEKRAALRDTLRYYKPNNRSPQPPTEASPVWIRKHRNIQNGLLLIYVFQTGSNEEEPYPEPYIGFAFSFPDSDTANPVKYKIDEVYRRNDYDDGIE